jgi:hypothetical protein
MEKVAAYHPNPLLLAAKLVANENPSRGDIPDSRAWRLQSYAKTPCFSEFLAKDAFLKSEIDFYQNHKFFNKKNIFRKAFF